MDWTLIAATAAEPTFLMSLALKAWTIFKVAAGLGFVIFVHELGHFLVAKACGVKCDKFYVGFDVPISIGPLKLPAKLIHFQWGETEYGVGILPLGGYVKMLGQDDDPRNTEAELERSRAVQKTEKTENGEVLTADEFVDHDYGPLDPRSFPAKSVPARMAIISAGVIMNVIFAVVLAGIAYTMGVQYQPAILGETIVGSPAWQAGWRPGDQILQLGKNGKPNENLRFWEDVRKRVIFHGSTTDLDVLLRKADGGESWSTVRSQVLPGSKYGTLGIQPTPSLKFGERLSYMQHITPPSSAEFLPEDKIVAVDGEEITEGWKLHDLLALNFDRPVKFTIERKSDKPEDKDKPAQKLDVEVAPLPKRTVGIELKQKHISAVRPGSPAEKAGVQAGDFWLEVDGEPVGDLTTIAQRLTAKTGKEVSLLLKRGTEQVTVTVTPEPRKSYDQPSRTYEPLGVDALGLALETEDVIVAVEPGSAAEAAELTAGDQLVSAELDNADPKILESDGQFLKQKKNDAAVFDFTKEGHDWPYFAELMQQLHDTTKVKLTVKRGGDTKTVLLTPVASEKVFDESRNLPLQYFSKTRRAEGVSDALSLGLRETWERLGEVVTTLTMLATGRVSPADLSGPLGILGMAGSQASLGIAQLLIFLTLLSANLAVINFLPIPALDGGHMLFLTAEWIRGKPVDPNLQMRLTIGGILALLSLMIFATAMDFNRLLFG